MNVKNLSRRRVLRGVLNGGVVAVSLPVLDCFLNTNGTAFANGAPLPLRFGTWFWGLGGNNAILVPKKTGTGYEIPQQLAPVARVREHVNLITNLTAFRDGEPNLCHYSGWIIGRTGRAPGSSAERPGETIDVTIANEVGRASRFRTLTASATGDFRNTVSYENSNSPNPPEISPLEFYARLYGTDFQDPNSPVFTPNPRAMARRSVLSVVQTEIKTLEKTVGAADRQRLDQYFTGLRHLEKQFDQQLTKPEPIAARTGDSRNRQGSQWVQAFRLPALERIGVPESLVLPSGLASRGRGLEIWAGGGSKESTVYEVLERGADFDRVTVF